MGYYEGRKGERGGARNGSRKCPYFNKFQKNNQVSKKNILEKWKFKCIFPFFCIGDFFPYDEKVWQIRGWKKTGRERKREALFLLLLLLLLFCPGGNKRVAESCLSLVWRGGGKGSVFFPLSFITQPRQGVKPKTERYTQETKRNTLLAHPAYSEFSAPDASLLFPTQVPSAECWEKVFFNWRLVFRFLEKQTSNLRHYNWFLCPASIVAAAKYVHSVNWYVL